MSNKFDDLKSDMSPERLERIEKRLQQLESKMDDQPQEKENRVYQKKSRLAVILGQIELERMRQDEKWGPPESRTFLTYTDFVTILAEEVGELAEAALDHRFVGNEVEGMREEAIQVAAVAVAICEQIDIREGK